MTERMIEANSVGLCTEPFGDPEDPAILLVQGIGASMLWWDERFCRTLSDHRCFAIRYDNRDTGRSVTYERGHPGYTGADLVGDAVAVLDAYGIRRAHIVGISAGGALAQFLALQFPDRVRSLVLISTSVATPGDRDPLPSPTDEFRQFFSSTQVDWSDRDSSIEYLVRYSSMLAGNRRWLDERLVRDLVCRDIDRARDFPAAQNHYLLADGESTTAPLSSIRMPTLVIHGTADPMFPVEHGEALAREISGAKLLRLEGAGHGIHPADREMVAAAIADHSLAADRAR